MKLDESLLRCLPASQAECSCDSIKADSPVACRQKKVGFRKVEHGTEAAHQGQGIQDVLLFESKALWRSGDGID
jgi:hypothetical protein